MPSAAILAGGRATRFGGLDKGAVIVQGRSILDRQLTALAQVTDDILYVGAKPPAEYRDLLREVPDLRPGLGPLGGLDTALSAARDDTVLVIAGDMPFLTAEFLEYVARMAGAAGSMGNPGNPGSPGSPGSIDAAVPRTARGRHPLAAAYRRACKARVRARLAAGTLAMRGLLEELQVLEIGPDAIAQFGDPERLLANVNTQADLDQVQSLAGHTR
jgi:molybdopterin-guanine dinucleotide biosynthesis protein A